MLRDLFFIKVALSSMCSPVALFLVIFSASARPSSSTLLLRFASGIAFVVAPLWRSSDGALAEPPSVELSTLTLVNVGCSLERATMADVRTAAPIIGYDCKGYDE